MPQLAEILQNVANTLPVKSVNVLEMMNAKPIDAIQFAQPGKGGYKKGDAVLAKSFKDFISYVTAVGAMGKSPLTGSCGQTSSWLDKVTTKDAVEVAMTEEDAGRLLTLLRGVTQARWYCRITSGQHSFLLEYADSCYCAYQSYFGMHSIQACINNLRKGEYVFKGADFFDDLEKALISPDAWKRLKDAEAERTIKDPSKLLEEKEKIKGDWGELWMDAGTIQAKIFHGASWTVVERPQYRLNLAPASTDEILQNITNGIKPNEGQWEDCFSDSTTSVEGLLS